MSGEQRRRVSVSKVLLFLALLAPLAYLMLAAAQGRLGADPAKAVVDSTGLWAIRILLLCLAMTPLRRITRISVWAQYRRMLGLFALFYALLHVSSYVFLLFVARWSFLLTEITKRPYIIAGAAALALMLPLGATSTRAWQRRLRHRWVLLHRLVYPVALLALVHFSWVKKLGLNSIAPYAICLFVLLGVRLWWRIQRFFHKPEITR